MHNYKYEVFLDNEEDEGKHQIWAVQKTARKWHIMVDGMLIFRTSSGWKGAQSACDYQKKFLGGDAKAMILDPVRLPSEAESDYCYGVHGGSKFSGGRTT